MEKKNGLIITVIVVLSILVGLLGGYVLSDTLSDKSQINSDNNINSDDVNKHPDNSQNNNEGTSNEDNKTEETDFNLVEAKKIMDKYLYESSDRTLLYIRDLSDENLKNYLALNNTKSKQRICSDIYGRTDIQVEYDSVVINGATAGGYCENSTDFYSYNEVLETKKILFGNGSKLDKKFIEKSTGSTIYDYVEKSNGFALLDCYCGGEGFNNVENSIKSAKISDNVLKILTEEIVFEIVGGSMPEIDKNKIIKKTEYEYTFNKNNGNYYLIKVQKKN